MIKKLLWVIVIAIVYTIIGGVTNVSALSLEPNANYIHIYSQGDSKWQSVSYNGNNLYISGCGIFTVSHAAQWLGVEQFDSIESLPVKFSKITYYGYNTFSGMDLYTKGFSNDYGLSFEWRYDGSTTISWNELFGKAGVAVLKVPSGNGHWVLAVGISSDNSKILVVDSWVNCIYSVGAQAWSYNDTSQQFVRLVSANDWKSISRNGTLFGGAQYWISANTATSYRLGSNYILPNKIRINEVTFPDPNFCACVLANYSDGNGYVDQSISYMDISYQNIQDMRGIQFFPALSTLICAENQITSLDLSSNTALTQLSCSGNPLTSLNISKNTLLTSLDCQSTKLTAIDLSENINLKNLSLQFSPVVSLNITNNTQLESLNCLGCSLLLLDVSHNTKLDFLNCTSNNISTLDVSQNSILRVLACGDNPIQSLDISHNTILEQFGASGCLLKSLDVSNNPLLWYLNYSKNRLTSLDLSQYSNILSFDGTSNPQIGFTSNGEPLSSYSDWLGNRCIDLKTLYGGNQIDFKRVTMTDNGSLNKQTGIVTYTLLPEFITYSYDTLAPNLDSSLRMLSVAAPTDNYWIFDSNNSELLSSSTFSYGVNIQFSVSPYYQNNQRWTPVSWQTNPSGIWTEPPYSAEFTTLGMDLGEHILTVYYAHELFIGSTWTPTGRVSSIETSYRIENDIPQTGDQSHSMFWILLIVFSIVAVLILLCNKKVK